MPDPGYEKRDINVPVVLGAVALLAVGFGGLLAVLYAVFQGSVAAGPGLPVVTAGERPLNDRLATIPDPRLEGLRELQQVPPTVSPSAETPTGNSPEYHPEDLRPERQAGLHGYEWVDRGKGIARIPIDRAMGIVASGQIGGTP
jgi:hypothetical protein